VPQEMQILNGTNFINYNVKLDIPSKDLLEVLLLLLIPKEPLLKVPPQLGLLDVLNVLQELMELLDIMGV